MTQQHPSAPSFHHARQKVTRSCTCAHYARVAPPGELHGPMSIPFEFSRVEMPYESYHGINVRLRYLLRVTMQRSYGNTVVQEFKAGSIASPRAFNR